MKRSSPLTLEYANALQTCIRDGIRAKIAAPTPAHDAFIDQIQVSMVDSKRYAGQFRLDVELPPIDSPASGVCLQATWDYFVDLKSRSVQSSTHAMEHDQENRTYITRISKLSAFNRVIDKLNPNQATRLGDESPLIQEQRAR